MKIRTIGLIGAGAVGAYFIWGFAEVPEVEFFLVAEGERKERLEKDGVLINGTTYRLPVKTPEEAAGTDLFLLAVKYSGLAESIGMIERAVGENSLVLSLMNGIDSEERIADAIGEKRTVRGLMKIASRRFDGKVEFSPEATLGLYFGGKDEETLDALSGVFAKSRVNYQVSNDIIRDQWKKFRVNVCYNLPQALLDVGYGAYFRSAHVEAMLRALEREVILVAEAEGIHLEPMQVENQGYPDTARYSTLQDLDAKRHTEVDMFAGVLEEKGRVHGIETPTASFILHAIHALEEKNDGLFAF